MYLYLHPYLPQLLSTYLMSGQVPTCAIAVLLQRRSNTFNCLDGGFNPRPTYLLLPTLTQRCGGGIHVPECTLAARKGRR